MPLGYDLKDHKLIVNEVEATTVKMIFERFTKIGSATRLVLALRSEGVTGKRGKLVDKGYLYKLLNNRVYVGDAVHKGTAYAGGHLLAPFGWAADTVASMIEVEPTLLIPLFELDRARMHLIALALAHLN